MWVERRDHHLVHIRVSGTLKTEARKSLSSPWSPAHSWHRLPYLQEALYCLQTPATSVDLLWSLGSTLYLSMLSVRMQ